MNLRQSILVRTDLGFSVGLMAAQCSHIHMQLLRKAILEKEPVFEAAPQLDSGKFPVECELSSDMIEWLHSPYVFIHGVPNREVLEHFVHKAIEAKIDVETWSDCVFINISETQREAFPDILVGASLGPTDSDKIKAIIGDLPLLSK